MAKQSLVTAEFLGGSVERLVRAESSPHCIFVRGGEEVGADFLAGKIYYVVGDPNVLVGAEPIVLTEHISRDPVSVETTQASADEECDVDPRLLLT